MKNKNADNADLGAEKTAIIDIDDEAKQSPEENGPQKYALLLRVIHWLMALCILGLIAVGWYMAGIPKDDPGKYDLYSWHKSFGVLTIFLIVLRIGVRIATKVPPLPDGIKKCERRLAKAGHGLLYVGMILVPVSGYIMSDAGGYSVKFFGILMPDFLDKNKDIGSIAHELHEIVPYVLLAVIALHIAGVIKHKCFDKKSENDVLKRMI